jgi:hypothetical protein
MASDFIVASEASLVGIAMHSRSVRSMQPILGCCIQFGNSRAGERRSNSSGVPGLAFCSADELPDRLPDLDKAHLEPDLETVRDELDPDSREPDLGVLIIRGCG